MVPHVDPTPEVPDSRPPHRSVDLHVSQGTGSSDPRKGPEEDRGTRRGKVADFRWGKEWDRR